jgi:WD40 repeat protein
MVKVWNISDIHNLTCVHTQQTRCQGIRAITLSLDTKRVYVACDGFVMMLSTANHTCLQTLLGNNGNSLSWMIEYQEKRLLSVERNALNKGVLKILDLPSNVFIKHIQAHDSEISSVAFFNSGQRVFSIAVNDSNDSTIKVWSV